MHGLPQERTEDLWCHAILPMLSLRTSYGEIDERNPWSWIHLLSNKINDCNVSHCTLIQMHYWYCFRVNMFSKQLYYSNVWKCCVIFAVFLHCWTEHLKSQSITLFCKRDTRNHIYYMLFSIPWKTFEKLFACYFRDITYSIAKFTKYEISFVQLNYTAFNQYPWNVIQNLNTCSPVYIWHCLRNLFGFFFANLKDFAS